MIRSRLTTWLKKLDGNDCLSAIMFLNQIDSEPENYSAQFHACNMALRRKARSQGIPDEKAASHRCDFCTYDVNTVRRVVRYVCPA